MNWLTVHTIQVICVALGAGLPVTSTAFPDAAHPYFLGAAALFVLIGGTLGVLSPSVKPDGDA